MLDIGIQELLVIMVLALIVFGPDKLPELGRRLGRAMREFRRASDEFRSTVEQNLQLHVDQDISPPSPSPLEPTSASVAPSSGTEGNVAGASDANGSGAQVAQPAHSGRIGAEEPTAEDLLEPYWTSRGGRLLHRRECAWRARVPASEQIPVKAVADGLGQGLHPCPVCDPKEVAVPS
jgi:TatA/E family protein of Tat protein translocase